MSKKPLADDRRREQATEAFAKVVRAAFKGESEKAKEAVAALESQFSEEVDILDRARRFSAMDLTKDTGRLGKPRNNSERVLAGVIALNQDELEEAEKIFSDVLNDDAKSAAAHYSLAIVRARREKVEEAIASLKTACALSPDRRAQARLDGEFKSLLGNPAFETITAS